MRRELSDEAVKYQAEAFMAHALRKGESIEFAFAQWARTKDFTGADLAAIRQTVLQLRKESA